MIEKKSKKVDQSWSKLEVRINKSLKDIYNNKITTAINKNE